MGPVQHSWCPLQLERTRSVLVSVVVGGQHERVGMGTRERDTDGRDP